MGLLFNRIVRVTFGRPGTIGTRVSGLFTQFEVEKTSEKNPNTVTIKIHNLNSTSRGVLQEKGLLVRLEAGYNGIPEELFLGNIKKAAVERQKTEYITTIEAGDAVNNLQTKQINISLGPGANTKQALEALTKELGVGLGSIKGLSIKKFQQGITLNGPVHKKLDEIVGKMGLEWSIQDGKMQVLPKNSPSEILGTLLTPQTGLIGSPVKKDDGLEFKALMMPSLKPGVAVQIASEDVNGFFKIRKARYEGDNRKGPFMVTCEAKELASAAVIASDRLNVSGIQVEGFA